MRGTTPGRRRGLIASAQRFSRGLVRKLQFCYGRFYDAGEFRDYAEFTAEDFFKRFTVKPRY